MRRRPAPAARIAAIAAMLAALAPGGPAARAAAAGPGGIMALVRADRWVEAEGEAAALPDPVARKLVTFYRMLAPGQAGVAELDAFRAANPNWPLQPVLQRRREEAIVAEPDDAVALAACVRERPDSAAALLRCADGALRRDRAAEALGLARAAWVAAAPDPRWEATFLRAWGDAIGPGEQWRRFDRLAWFDTAGAAEQVARLSPDDQARAEARLGLRRDDPQAASLLAALPPAQQGTPAMLLERARWLRRGGHGARAAAVWLQAGAAAERAAAPEHRALFWDERNRLARDRLAAADPQTAYALAASDPGMAPEQAAEAAFLAGWIALRRLSDPARAATQFAVVARVSRAAITQARAYYWLGRAAAASGDMTGARHDYALAAAYPSTYYGQLAALASGADPARLAARIVATRDPGWTQAQAAAFARAELVRAGVWLAGWGEPGRAAAFLLRLSDVMPEPADQALAARLATSLAMPQTAVALARLAGRSGLVLLDTGWPIAASLPAASPADAAAGAATDPDPALALGVIRQESSFDPAIVSPAGARGLMQLMPATAAAEARRLGLPVSAAALTADPAYNILLGIAYLRRLLAGLGGSVPLAVAAYNAGPSRVAGWLASNGDPRHPPVDDGALEMTDWIELIPFSETRNYVQRVIESAVVYQAKLGEAAPTPLPWHPSPA